MCDRINLPKTITDRANTLFKMVHDGRNLKGRANEAIASACLYIACRQEGVPRTFKEIVAVSTVSKKVKCSIILQYIANTSGVHFKGNYIKFKHTYIYIYIYIYQYTNCRKLADVLSLF